jgi:hypothetical protein
MRQKIPIIGQHFVKEVPPSDNVRTGFCSILSLFSHGCKVNPGVLWFKCRITGSSGCKEAPVEDSRRLNDSNL